LIFFIIQQALLPGLQGPANSLVHKGRKNSHLKTHSPCIVLVFLSFFHQ
jgi:hypothetical protein